MDGGQFRDLGCLPQIDRAGNVIAYLNTRRQGPFFAVTAHLDTVLAPRREEDIHYGADGRLYGPGVSDNGAGLTALLALAAAIKSSPDLEEMLDGVVFIANVGEEGEGNLSRARKKRTGLPTRKPGLPSEPMDPVHPICCLASPSTPPRVVRNAQT